MKTPENSGKFVSGFVAIVGRPNVGKSTLLNRILGEPLAITTPKPQTTRNQIRGILNIPGAQVVFVDTPGVPLKPLPEKKRVFQDFLVEEATHSLEGVDAVLFLIDAQSGPTEDDLRIWQQFQKKENLLAKTLFVLNKVDQLGRSRDALLPWIARLHERIAATEIFPCSARSGDGVPEILQAVLKRLPAGPALYPEDQLSDRNDRFLSAEIIREYLFLSLDEEVPYSTAVEVEEFQESDRQIRIRALIYVERESQKGIVIGKQGAMLKKVGTLSREKMEKNFGKKIFLELYVKVLTNWTTDEKLLKRLGYSVQKHGHP